MLESRFYGRCSPVSCLRVFGTPYHGMVSEGLLSIHHGLQIHCIINVNICIKGPDDQTVFAGPRKYLNNYYKKKKICKNFAKERKEKKKIRGEFQPGYQVEIAPRLNSKLLFKMTLQLHVKISTRYTELKFQLGLAKPR